MSFRVRRATSAHAFLSSIAARIQKSEVAWQGDFWPFQEHLNRSSSKRSPVGGFQQQFTIQVAMLATAAMHLPLQ